MMHITMATAFIALGYFIGIAKILVEKGLFWPFVVLLLLMSFPLGNGHI